MNPKKVIIIQKDGEPVGVFGSLTDVCDKFNLPYFSLKAKKFPFEVEGYKLWKFEYGVPQGIFLTCCFSTP